MLPSLEPNTMKSRVLDLQHFWQLHYALRGGRSVRLPLPCVCYSVPYSGHRRRLCETELGAAMPVRERERERASDEHCVQAAPRKAERLLLNTRTV